MKVYLLCEGTAIEEPYDVLSVWFSLAEANAAMYFQNNSERPIRRPGNKSLWVDEYEVKE